MVEPTTTWSVVAMVDEPPALLQAFVAWHLGLGAAEIFLYFDRPDDPAQHMFAHLPQVRVVACDAAHWSALGKSRPARHQVRQVQNARHAYALTRSAWLLHADADEFVWVEGSVADCLAGVVPAADCFVLPVAERIHRPGENAGTILDGPFRRPFPGRFELGQRLFGPTYALTNRGLTGHLLGKAFVRTGRDLRLSIHRPRHGELPEPQIARADRTQLELLHFDGLTPEYWIYKLMRMASALVHRNGMPPSRHRRAQADALLANPDGALGLYDQLKVIDDDTRAILLAQDLFAAPSFDPQGALAQFFPGMSVDLSPGAIDAWLRDHKSDIRAFLRG
ncbi:glycosyltransferase family 2 protein [Yoonia sp. SS1-5]|uniref:Glycosyltransferase family 2 protein n=1 Tax=Yoonia rhodophyticola TaxID=3137370 RepID=A0AAN0NIK3_9RHOB